MLNSDLSHLIELESEVPLTRKVDGALLSHAGHRYPVVKGIPRFVPSENYAQDSGMQWNRFPKAQLDSHTALRRWENRVQCYMQAILTELASKWVLEAGSGAGRFTEILLCGDSENQGSPSL